MGQRDQSVWDEPNIPGGAGPSYRCEACGYDLRGTSGLARCPECGVRLTDPPASTRKIGEAEAAEHSVWNEPMLEGDEPEGAASFRSRLAAKVAATSAVKSWLFTLLAATAAGPFAVFGAVWGSGQSIGGYFTLVVFGPLVEETMKIGVMVMAVELAPYLIRSRLQILLTVGASGLVFAAIENVMYLSVYIEDPSETIIVWRWTVCVALHTGCSLIAGIGVMRIWAAVMRTGRRADVSLGTAYLVLATVIHGAYNAAMVALEMTAFKF